MTCARIVSWSEPWSEPWSNRSAAPPLGCFWTAEQVRDLDAQAIAGGISGYELMQRAGLSAWCYLKARWPQVKRLILWLGSGNNAGDGLVLARWAHSAGVAVVLLQVGVPKYSGTAAQVWREACALGLSPTQWQGEALTGMPDDGSTIQVDALLGTGVHGAPALVFTQAIAAINAAALPVLALDIPTGIHPDSGGLTGSLAVQAAATVSFVGAKRGLYTGAGGHYAGVVQVDTLDVPSDLQRRALCRTLDMQPPPLPQRPLDAHKGNFGHVLVLGGQQGMSGATLLAARAAARAGAGWVSVGSQGLTIQALQVACPEIMARTLDFASDGAEVLESLLERATLVVLGPGLGRSPWSVQLFAQSMAYLRRTAKPVVLDADALYWWRQQSDTLAEAIFTPHPGEAAMLLGTTAVQVQADRFLAVEQLVQLTKATVVLKGNGTLVSAPTAPVYLCRAGNPGMASAGMGDVLAGLTGGVWAQQADALSAACRGVHLHAATADALWVAGRRTILASDLVNAL